MRHLTPILLLALLAAAPAPAPVLAAWDTTIGAPGMGIGLVHDLVAFAGGVVAVGTFSTAGGVPCNSVAFWDGTSWSPLGSGVDSEARCAFVRDGSLYVGGFFHAAGGVPGTAHLARWDGEAWQAVGSGTNGPVYAIGTFGTDLVVGGSFSRAGGDTANCIARWDGAQWHALGDGFLDYYVSSLTEYRGELIAGGRFTFSGSVLVNSLARWDGHDWKALGEGVDDSYIATVDAMAVLGDDLLVGGRFSQAGAQALENLALWDGSQWHTFTDVGFAGVSGNGVTAIQSTRDGLVIGGCFTGLDGVPGTAHLAQWDGAAWAGLGGGTDNNVSSLLVYGSDLVVGGSFSQAGGANAGAVAVWNGELPPTRPESLIHAWGDNRYHQTEVPASDLGYTAVAAGSFHNLGLRPDGSVVGWGDDYGGRCTVPAPNSGFVAVAAGDWPSVGLKADGTIVTWGNIAAVPAPNSGFVGIAAGEKHCLGLKADGSVVAWGDNQYGQCDVPAPNAGFVAVEAGLWHSLGLKADGSIVAWGSNDLGQCAVPAPNSGFVAVAGGSKFSLGVKADGRILAWGDNQFGQCTVPQPNAGFVAASGGWSHSLGLREDGTVAAWGNNWYGQCTVPPSSTGYAAIAAGLYHSTGLTTATFKPSVADFPDDEGGRVTVAWARHRLDDAAQPVPVTEYELQRLEVVWRPVTTVAAAGADTYRVDVTTADILVLGQPAPASHYRLVARTGDPGVQYTSLTTSGYSIDNIPPKAPLLSVFDTETSRVLVWQDDDVPDFAETCLYRGTVPGFPAGAPIYCTATEPWWYETHLARYYYRARSTDSHGNVGPWSEDVVGHWPTPVPGAGSPELALHPCRPNPFNPRTGIRFDLPAAGPVRLTVFDLAGRVVRTLVDGELPAGSHETVWDGRDAAGRDAASGSYLALLRFDGQARSIRLGLVR